MLWIAGLLAMFLLAMFGIALLQSGRDFADDAGFLFILLAIAAPFWLLAVTWHWIGERQEKMG